MNQESTFLLKNYSLFLQWKEAIARNYKILIKDIGCNAQCPFCDDWRNRQNKEKIISQAYKLLETISKEQVRFKSIEILGGEPLLVFQDIITIVEICKKAGILISFPTNASLLTREKIDILIEKWLKSFTFSLDFADENHDTVRHLKWTYKKILDFTEYIQSLWVVVKWNSIVGKFNLKNLPKFSELYKNWYSPDIHNFIAIEKNNIFSEENLLSQEEKKEALYKIKNIRNHFFKWRIIVNGFEENWGDLEKEKCFVPLTMRSYYITEDAISISPCHFDSKAWVQNIENFTKKAVTEGCNLCKSSCKSQINKTMSEAILSIKN